MRVVLACFFAAVVLLFYAGMEAYILEGSPGMHSLHGRLILSALVLLLAGVSVLTVFAVTLKRGG